MSVWFEDVEIGSCREIGSHVFTRESIIAFAKKFDPQPFHLSDKGAAASPFGKLCASGWHTASVWMKLMVEDLDRQTEEQRAAGRTVAPAGPSPGIRQLKWIKPVYVGDTVSYRIIVTGKQDWRGKSGWGLIVTMNEGHNQYGELVFSFIGQVLFPRRSPAPA